MLKSKLKTAMSKKSLISTDVLIQSMPNMNEEFIDACENGDLLKINTILLMNKDFNIEITDDLGRTPLRLAIENEHLDVVKVLLDRCDSQRIKDSLLLAIFKGYISIAEAILKHPKYKILNEKKLLNGDTDSFWAAPSSDDAQFSPDITPIMLAAQYNRTEIVQMLLLNGDRILKPHDFNCKCTECFNKFKFDSLRHAQSRLNAYKGLASESLISLASIDPILTAFEMSRELMLLSEKEKYFKHEYLHLHASLSNYVVKLLHNVRGTEELEIVLNKTGRERQEKYERLARLDLALKYQEKTFVANSNCQQKLIEIWYSGIRKVTKMNIIFILGLIILHVALLPITSVIYIFFPKSKLVKFMDQPCVKFISHLASYLCFVAMIIAHNIMAASSRMDVTYHKSFLRMYPNFTEDFANYTHREPYKIRDGLHLNFRDFFIREYVPSNIDIIIIVWVAGQSWHEIKQLFSSGLIDYLHSPTNLFKFCMNVFYLASYGLKFNTMMTVAYYKNIVVTHEFWECAKDTSLANQSNTYDALYWLNSDRFYWQNLDPIHLSEGFFSIANVLTFTRLCFYLYANQQLGPLQITLGKMIKDAVKFICIFAILFSAFVFGINHLYSYYSKEFRSSVEVIEHSNGDEEVKADEAFGSLGSAFLTLFFAIYTIGDSTDPLIEPFENVFTVGIGYLLFVLFHIANITIMINMLIAMMTKSYQDIIHDSDMEWKFARSKLYMEYIKEGSTLPAPLNLLPAPFAIYKTVQQWCRTMKEQKKRKMRRSKSSSGIMADPQSNAESRSHVSVFESEKAPKTGDDNVDKLTYAVVMERVVKRFLLHNKSESDDIKQNEFEDLKEQLQMLKADMIVDLKKSREDIYQNLSSISSSVRMLQDDVNVNTNERVPMRYVSLTDSQEIPATPLTGGDRVQNERDNFYIE